MIDPFLEVRATSRQIQSIQFGATVEDFGDAARLSFLVIGRSRDRSSFHRNDFKELPENLHSPHFIHVDRTWTTVSGIHCVIYVYAEKVHVLAKSGAHLTVARDGDFSLDGLVLCIRFVHPADSSPADLPSLDDLVPLGEVEALKALRERLEKVDRSLRFNPKTQQPGIEELKLGTSSLSIVWTKTQGGPLWRAFTRHLQAFAEAWRTHHKQHRVVQCRLPAEAGKALRSLHDDVVVPAAQNGLSLLVLGETGTGKSRIARCYHQHSGRNPTKYVEVDCSMFGPDETREMRAKLFGAKKGAWNGLDHDIKGVVELANGGVLLLDEIGDLKRDLQPLLLRFLQEGVYTNYGETEELTADVKCVFATHQDLERRAFEGTFRSDLWYRITQGPTITLPALRDRRDELETLLKSPATIRGHQECPAVWEAMTSEARDYVLSHRWPGNFRSYERFRLLFPKNSAPGSVDVDVCRQIIPPAGGTRLPSEVNDHEHALGRLRSSWLAHVPIAINREFREWRASDHDGREPEDPQGEDMLARYRALHDARRQKRGHSGYLTAFGTDFLLPFYVAWWVTQHQNCTFDTLPERLPAEVVTTLARELVTLQDSTITKHYRRFLELWRSEGDETG